jgi:GGDEF domain-containing protein
MTDPSCAQRLLVMALLGPMVVVAETSATDFIDVLGKAGAFPIAQTRWPDVPAAIAETQPVALAIAEPQAKPSPRHVDATIECIETRGGPIMPVIARVDMSSTPAIPGALPIAMNESDERLTAQLLWALRIRTLHATVLRRSRTPAATKKVPTFVPPDLLEDAAVLCVARGGSYLALSEAIGQRSGLIGALSVETAARYLNARDVDGVVIGDGLGPRVAESLLVMLAENARFRDLPVGVLNNAMADDERLPNLLRVAADAPRLVERILPFVRLQAFAGQLTRTLRSLESEQAIDPDTGLLAAQTFWRKLERAVQESEETSAALAVARFTFDGVADRRAYIDAARLFNRLVRNIDFAYREQDGSILAAFTKTDLRSAHLLARRIASVLRQTMLAPDRDRRAIKPTITLAALKPTDDLSTLVARLGAHPKVAAE